MNPQKVSTSENEYSLLLYSVGSILEKSMHKVYSQMNGILIETYWEIGKRIVGYELRNKEKGGYGTHLFETLAKDLRNK